MKLLHVCETIPGGIGGYLDELLVQQVSDLKEVIIIAPQEHLSFFDSELKGLKVHHYKRSGRNLKSFINLFFKLKEVLKVEKPDIVIFHSTFAGVIGRLLVAIPGVYSSIRVVYYPHGVSMIMKTNSELKNKVYAFLERILAKFACDKVICVSNFEQEVMKKYDVGGSKVETIYNGISPPKHLQVKAEHDELRVLFVGRYDSEKGLHILLEALRTIDRKSSVALVGGATRPQEKLEYPAHTVDHGWLERRQIESLYQWADVVVVPSEWEAMGLVAVEAMSNATAVVASRVGGLTEVVEDNVTGILFDIDDKAALRNILNNTPIPEFHEMGRKSRLRYEENFSSRVMYERTKNMLENLYAGVY